MVAPVEANDSGMSTRKGEAKENPENQEHANSLFKLVQIFGAHDCLLIN